MDAVIEADNNWREASFAVDQKRGERGQVQKEITAAFKAKQKPSEDLMARKAALDKAVEELESALAPLAAIRDRLLGSIGNIVHDSVPVSNDEDADNDAFVHWPGKVGEGYTPPDVSIPHHQLLWMIGGYEPDRGVKVAGHKGYFLRDAGVLLNQAIVNYGLAFARARGYSLLQPPYMMNKDVMAGVAQLSEFDEALYKVTGESDQYLIATSEQPICGFHKSEWLQESTLPLKYCGLSMCFRKEAGSHGRDIWGIFRVHQFTKVEQFVLCEGDLEKSDAMQREMLAHAEALYQSLEIPYRVVNIVSGELNNAAIKKYDLEGYFPASYKEYRELVSCSNCTDYQARAMEVRCGSKKAGEREKRYVHMLNSTLAACTRTMCIILENFQTPSGVRIPEPLVPFMGGMTFLPFTRAPKKDWEGAPKKGTFQLSNASFAAAYHAQEVPRAPAPKPPAAEAKEAAAPAPAAAAAPALSAEAAALVEQIAAKGVEIRDLKKSGVKDKEALQPHIDALLLLKAKYQEATGEEYIAPGTQGNSKKKKKKAKEEAKAKEPKAQPRQPEAKAQEPKAKPQQPKPKPQAAAGAGQGALAELDAFLLRHPYCGGFQPSAADRDMLAAVGDKDVAAFANVKRWLSHVASFEAAERAAW